jgi:hypothetical protein
VVASLQNHPFSFALRGRAIPGQVPRLPGTARFFFLKWAGALPFAHGAILILDPFHTPLAAPAMLASCTEPREVPVVHPMCTARSTARFEKHSCL